MNSQHIIHSNALGNELRESELIGHSDVNSLMEKKVYSLQNL